MGAAASVISWKKKEVYSVDIVLDRKVKVFSKAIFKRYEWIAMKSFAQRYKITQKDLVRVFSAYLSHEEVYLREFRVKTMDPRNRFLHQSKLMQEMADIFIPAIYLKQFKGLEPVESNEEVSFARFVIHSYIFCAQQVPDLIYNFLAILKQKFNIPVSLVVPFFAFQELCKLLFEDLQGCGALMALRFCLKRVKEESSIRLGQIVRMGVKYPLLMFMVTRFRSKYRHHFMGDKFWADRPMLKLKHLQIDDADGDVNRHFLNEVTARRRTAQMLIADCIYATQHSIVLDDVFHRIPASLSPQDATKVKAKLGYKIAKLIIVESELPMDFVPTFLDNFYKLPPPSLVPAEGGVRSDGALQIDSHDDQDEDEAGDGLGLGEMDEAEREGISSAQKMRKGKSLLTDASDAEADGEEKESGSAKVSRKMSKKLSRLASSKVAGLEDVPPDEEDHAAGEAADSVEGEGADIDKGAAAAEPSTLTRLTSSLLEKTSSITNLIATTIASMRIDFDEYEIEEPPDIFEDSSAVVERPVGATIVHDNKFNRDFAFDLLNGRSRWAKVILDPNGNVFKQFY